MKVMAMNVKLKGAGRRYQPCPGGCGKTLDLTRDAVALGDGGWWCRECTDAERQRQFNRKEKDKCLVERN